MALLKHLAKLDIPGGGQVVAQGTPDEVPRPAQSYTRQFLRKVL